MRREISIGLPYAFRYELKSSCLRTAECKNSYLNKELYLSPEIGQLQGEVQLLTGGNPTRKAREHSVSNGADLVQLQSRRYSPDERSKAVANCLPTLGVIPCCNYVALNTHNLN